MFRKLYLKNFKVWGEQLWDGGVELAPVTLFLGTNSAGKTSLLQMFLLLKQTFESHDPNLDLNLGGQTGDIADFGTYEDIIHDHSKKKELGIGVDVDISLVDGLISRYGYRATFTSKLGVPEVSRLELTRDVDPPNPSVPAFSLTRKQMGGYELKAPTRNTEFNELDATLDSTPTAAKRRFHPERGLFFPADALHALGPEKAHVQTMTLSLLQAFREVFYLGPLRDYPKRTYLWNRQRPGEIGPRGDQAVAALLASANAPKRAKKTDDDEGVNLVDQVSRWLQEFKIADMLTLKRQGQSRYYDVVIVRNGKSASLVDVGFGVSQVLPMIVLAYFVPRGSTIIAEQPEIHLHPLAQSALADLMVEVARERNVQFLVETHSEHMFRRLQFLVADEKVRPEDCRLYFVNKDKAGAAALEKLQLDPYGRIENWPDNFFGDALGETERQMARVMSRMIAKLEDGQ